MTVMCEKQNVRLTMRKYSTNAALFYTRLINNNMRFSIIFKYWQQIFCFIGKYIQKTGMFFRDRKFYFIA